MTISAPYILKSEIEMSERKRLRLQRSMILDSNEPEDFGHWIMLDLMTLILVFFIILYANLLQSTSVITVKGVKTSPTQTLKPVVSKIVNRLEKINQQSKVEEKSVEFYRVEKNIKKAMEHINIKDFSIEINQNRLKLILGEKISFSIGSAQLLNEIKEPLKQIAQFLNREYTYKIIISGHTDNIPIHMEKYPSNWDLSVARALSVAKFLMKHDVDPYNLSVEGYGQYNPIADNDSWEGRKANRRVEISFIAHAL